MEDESNKPYYSVTSQYCSVDLREYMYFYTHLQPFFIRTFLRNVPSVAYRGVGLGVQPPPPEIPKSLQNRAKLNSIVKTVKNC